MKLSFCALFSALALAASPASEPDAAQTLFHQNIKPLLDGRCLSCHGPDKQKGSLRLDSREALLKGGYLGPAIIPGNPSDSLLLQAVMHSKKDLEMPPKEKLSPQEIDLLAQWIRQGAPWPAASDAPAPAPLAPGERLGNAWDDPRNPIVRIFAGQRLDLWSLRPVRKPLPPPVRKNTWVRNPIDQFVLARLEPKGLSPSPEADRRTLARRLYLDLTGLPPTPEQLASFLADRSPSAYENLVDTLLNSPAYGEHWARWWLDVVRYSDSNGFDWDEFRPQAWRFRDYVVRSLNQDKPFNQFIREQLAGDELLDGPPKTPAEQDALIATTYLRLGPHDNSAPLFNEQARSRAELMADLVETTGSAFLGLTLSCCRCHDHKYDPLSQADHFRIRAFFEGVKFADDLPLDLADEQAAILSHNASIESKIKPLADERSAIWNEAKAALREQNIAKLSAEDQQLLARSHDEADDDTKKKIKALEDQVRPSDKDITKSLDEPTAARHRELGEQIDALKKQKRSFTTGLLMTDAEGEPPATRILFGGDHKEERDPVSPGFISILDPNPAPIEKGPNSKTTGRRLTLANWIASPENPLTARVLVNRAWLALFGEGLVATPNDFGLAGARPSHPALLDWLASEFVASGWSLKQLHRSVVTSATYRQASVPSAHKPSGLVLIGKRTTADPWATDGENHLFWRHNLRRLSAEQLRDSLLSVSGLLRPSAGGPPVWPELPTDILTANPAFLDDNETKTKGWYPSPPEERNVRTLYLIQKRTVRIPFLETFDLPENATSCPRRTQSVVAPQAFALLNGDTAVAAAKAFAARIHSEAGPLPEAQVQRAFALALLRSPTSSEQTESIAFLQKEGLLRFARALLNLNEFVYFD